MEQTLLLRKAWTLIGVSVLALTVSFMWTQSTTKVPSLEFEEMRDAVASPVSPAVLGGAHIGQRNAGYFTSPAERRAEAERVMSLSRPKLSKAAAARARAAKLRRERAAVVSQ